MEFQRRQKLKTEDLCQFFRVLRRYQNAGLPILQSLVNFDAHCDNAEMKQVLKRMIQDMKNGLPFSQAMAKHTVFPAFSTQLVKVGEEAGEMQSIFDEIVFHLEQQTSIAREMKASLFPAKFFLGGAVLAIILAIFFIIPKLQEILEDLNADLPLITSLVISTGSVLANGWPLFLALGAAGYVGYKYFKKTYPDKMDRLRLKVPFYGKLRYCELQYRMTKILSLVCHNNIPICDSLLYAAESVEHIPLERVLVRAAEEIKNAGTGAAEALERADSREHLIAKDTFVMLRAGEVSGEMGKVMAEISEDFRRDVLSVSKTLATKVGVSVIIPVMLCLIVIMGSVYAPILNMMSAANNIQ